MMCSTPFSPATTSNNPAVSFDEDSSSSLASSLLSDLQSQGPSGSSRSTLEPVVVPRASDLRTRPLLLLSARTTRRNSAMLSTSTFRNADGSSDAGTPLWHTTSNNNHDDCYDLQSTLLAVLHIVDQAILLVAEQDDDLLLADAEDNFGGTKNDFDLGQ